jgi:DNA invertase Pin-like site-specific DNA recombinase
MTDEVFDGYIRVSRVGDRAERLRSPEFQEREIRREAKKRGLRVGRVINDLDQSGARDDRPGLQEAIARIEASQSAGIIVAKLDRFSRNLTQATALAQRIMAAGGRIYSYAEPADWTTSDGELQINLALAIAQHQRRRANEYFESAKASAVERGVPINPRIAPGFRRDEATGKLVPDESASAIREVFERRVAGAGPAELAELLQARGVATSMGSSTWSKQAIYGLLRNRIYLGELRYGSHVNTTSHEAIVDRATWEAAQRERARLSPARNGDPFMLTGLIRCWSCRYALQATRTSRGKRIYRCTRRHAGGLCPDPARVDADGVEAFVEDEFSCQVGRRVAMEPVLDTSALEDGRRILIEAELELASYRDDVELRALIGRASWLDGLRERRERVAAAEDALAAARLDTPVAMPELRVLVEEFDAMDVLDRREALAQIIDCVALRSGAATMSLADRVNIFWAGTGPRDLPRRGFREQPKLRAFDLPPAAAVTSR